METVELMLEDLNIGSTNTPTHVGKEQVEAFVKERQPDYFSYDDWLRLNELEIANGESLGRPRLKFTDIAEMVKAVK